MISRQCPFKVFIRLGGKMHYKCLPQELNTVTLVTARTRLSLFKRLEAIPGPTAVFYNFSFYQMAAV